MLKNLIWVSMVLVVLGSCTTSEPVVREESFNDNWKFTLDKQENPYKVVFDDNSWRTLNLPHDWSVEFPFDSVKGEGCTAYLPGGIGWYRKHFDVDINPSQEVYVLFDGVYNNSEYWINGKRLGEHKYGYSPFYFNLTPYLINDGIENVLAVKVDHSRFADSRWYTGSGIYRNVKLITVNKLHTSIWGTFVTTPAVSEEKAEVKIQLTVNNNFDSEQTFVVVNQIIDPSGQVVGEVTSDDIMLNPGSEEYTFEVDIPNPDLWSTENPNIYKLETELVVNSEAVDTYTTKFGIRSIRFDAETGFYLNEKNMKIKGVCLHHDGGIVGAAVPKDVWKRRLEILKEGGCNAIRISHNPGSKEFLELCDEMGFLVQDEFFDEWDYPKDKRMNMWERHDDYISRGYADIFQENAHLDLKNTMLSHRNHPSIIQWSIGNEIEWTYPRNKKATGFFDNMDWSGNYFWSPPPYSPERIREEYNKMEALEYNIGETAQKLADWTREIDSTRPVIANCILPSASFETGYADALDIVGFSYRRVMYDYAKEHYPNKVVMGTENLPQWHEWKAIEERPFVSGTFLWTGIDYMGEANEQWPKKGTESGLLDIAGFKKMPYYMYKTLWTEEPVMYIASQTAAKSRYVYKGNGFVEEVNPGAWENALWEWPKTNEHWNYSEGEKVIVELISSSEEVELFLNDISLGKKKLSSFPDRIYKWAVPFEKGILRAEGTHGGNKIAKQIVSAGEPVAFKVVVDKQKLTSKNDVAHITIQLIDANGNPVKHTERKVNFKFDNLLENLGVDNGSIRSTQSFQSNEITTYKGRALCIVKGKELTGKASITISAEGLQTINTEIEIN